MGFLGEIAKVANKTKLGSMVTKAAKNIKTLATDIISGISGKEGLIARAYGKIKSVGSMALGMIFPSATDDTIQSLQAVASSSRDAGGTGFIGTFTESLRSAVGNAKTTASSITQNIKDAFLWTGQKVKDGVSHMYDSTVEFLGLKDKSKISNPGEWVATKSKERAAITGLDQIKSPTNQQLIDTALNKNPEFIKIANEAKTTPQRLISDQASFLGQRVPLHDIGELTDIGPEAAKIANIQGGTPGDISRDQAQFRAGLERFNTAPATKAGQETTSLLSRITGSAPELLTGLLTGLAGTGEATADILPSKGITPKELTAARTGIGGTGATGGQFLSEAQRLFFEQQSRQLGRAG